MGNGILELPSNEQILFFNEQDTNYLKNKYPQKTYHINFKDINGLTFAILDKYEDFAEIQLFLKSIICKNCKNKQYEEFCEDCKEKINIIIIFFNDYFGLTVNCIINPNNNYLKLFWSFQPLNDMEFFLLSNNNYGSLIYLNMNKKI